MTGKMPITGNGRKLDRCYHSLASPAYDGVFVSAIIDLVGDPTFKKVPGQLRTCESTDEISSMLQN